MCNVENKAKFMVAVSKGTAIYLFISFFVWFRSGGGGGGGGGSGWQGVKPPASCTLKT